MPQYKIGNFVVSPTDDGFQPLLARLYPDHFRPLCMCREPGLEMYIARIGEHYIVKRMPDSGVEHAADCDSYETPSELSGLGEVLGSAIQNNEKDGTTTLKFDFSLAKASGNSITPGPKSESSSVRTDGRRLTARGTLHYLYEEAKLNRWFPGMAGKRNWYVIYKHLLIAADGKESKGKPLGDMLYVPEPFSVDRKDEITMRRLAQITKIAAAPTGPRELMLLIAEAKEISEGRFGYKLIAKHLPDFPFLMDDELHRKMMKRFSLEMSMFRAIENSHLLVICTFGLGYNGVANLEEIAPMVTTENWIPIESMYEKDLIDMLTEKGRAFQKVLRYNLASDVPVASLILLDTKPNSTVMYVVPQDRIEDEVYSKKLEELIMGSSLDAWTWVVGKDMPEIPPKGYALSTPSSPARVVETAASKTVNQKPPASVEKPVLPATEPLAVEPVNGEILDIPEIPISELSEAQGTDLENLPE